MNITLPAVDAAEMADLLRFVSEWLTSDRDQLADSLARFTDGHPYGVDMLRHDLARFRHLLGDEDNDNDL